MRYTSPFGRAIHPDNSGFGRIPDVPEYDCMGDFHDDYCKNCDDYEKCKSAEYIDDWERFANENSTDTE